VLHVRVDVDEDVRDAGVVVLVALVDGEDRQSNGPDAAARRQLHDDLLGAELPRELTLGGGDRGAARIEHGDAHAVGHRVLRPQVHRLLVAVPDAQADGPGGADRRERNRDRLVYAEAGRAFDPRRRGVLVEDVARVIVLLEAVPVVLQEGRRRRRR